MLIDKLRGAADFQKLKEIPEEYFEELSRTSPESVLRLIGKIIAVLLYRLNVPRNEIDRLSDQIERREFNMLFEHFEVYDVQEMRRTIREEERNELKEEVRNELKEEVREEIRIEFETQARAAAVLELLEDLGPVPEAVQGRIIEEKDLQRLSRWHKAAARAESMEQFVKELQE